jgi:multidrug efflux pump subunit AcrA (membrane-fusion protein)
MLSIPALMALSIGAACRPAPPASTSPPAPIAVTTARAEAADLPSSFEAGAIVRARSTAVIASRVMAPVAAVHVRPGDRVRRGMTLVTLDARETSANSVRADAALTVALETSRAAESDTRAAESGLRLARATHDRMSTLYQKRSATAQEMDQAVAGLSAAEAQVAGAGARAAAAAAARDAARAAAEAARVSLSYTSLTAPFDGIVTERLLDPGSMAAPGTPLLTVEDTGLFRLEARVDEARAARVAVGDAVDIRLDEGGDGAWRAARVVEIARVDPSSHSFLIKVDVPGASGLRSGLFGRVRFAGPARRTLTVPESAVLRRGQLAFVFAVDDAGVARLRPITAGDVANGRVESLAGIREGEVVVVNPPLSLGDGVRVAAGAPGARR